MRTLNTGLRTSTRTIQSLTWWYKYFLPGELNFLFYLHSLWSIYDPLREINIATIFRNQFGSTHNNGIIQSLLAYFRCQPEIQLMQGIPIQNDLAFATIIIHLVPFTNVCGLCQEKLTATNCCSRRVKVICDQGRTSAGNICISII